MYLSRFVFLPASSKIASLSSGEFVGMVADNPEQKIKLKLFHSEIQNDHEAIAKEEAAYKPIPVVEYVSQEDVEENYKKIKEEIRLLIKEEMDKIEARQPKAEKPMEQAQNQGSKVLENENLNDQNISM